MAIAGRNALIVQKLDSVRYNVIMSPAGDVTLRPVNESGPFPPAIEDCSGTFGNLCDNCAPHVRLLLLRSDKLEESLNDRFEFGFPRVI